MWSTLAYIGKLLLNKNNSPAWNRITNLMGTASGMYNSGKSLWSKYNV